MRYRLYGIRRRRRLGDPDFDPHRHAILGEFSGTAAEHRAAVEPLVNQAYLQMDNADRSDGCTAAVNNAVAASYLVGKAKTHAESSGDAAAMKLVSQAASHADRMLVSLVEDKCVLPLARGRGRPADPGAFAPTSPGRPRAVARYRRRR